MQAQLDDLRVRFHVPLVISIRAPRKGELPRHARDELDEIVFPMVALECRVRLPLAPFVRKVLNEFPLHLLQVSPSLWENCLTWCIIWHKCFGQDLTIGDLKCHFRLRQ